MIGPTGVVKVMLATKPVDFRKGAEGLAGLVRDTMGADPFSESNPGSCVSAVPAAPFGGRPERGCWSL
ncbi:transposase [Mesorhizobium sp. B2-4-13]|nr:transposase [Mesorhizobium sp. B2-4-13]